MKELNYGNNLNKSGQEIEAIDSNDTMSFIDINRPLREMFEDDEISYQLLQSVLKTVYGNQGSKILPNVYEEFSADKLKVETIEKSGKSFLRLPLGVILAENSKTTYGSDRFNSFAITNRPNYTLFERELAKALAWNIGEFDNYIKVSYNQTKKQYELIYNYLVYDSYQTNASDPMYADTMIELINKMFDYFCSYIVAYNQNFNLEETIDITSLTNSSYALYYKLDGNTITTNLSNSERFFLVDEGDSSTESSSETEVENAVKIFSFTLTDKVLSDVTSYLSVLDLKTNNYSNANIIPYDENNYNCYESAIFKVKDLSISTPYKYSTVCINEVANEEAPGGTITNYVFACCRGIGTITNCVEVGNNYSLSQYYIENIVKRGEKYFGDNILTSDSICNIIVQDNYSIINELYLDSTGLSKSCCKTCLNDYGKFTNEINRCSKVKSSLCSYCNCSCLEQITCADEDSYSIICLGNICDNYYICNNTSGCVVINACGTINSTGSETNITSAGSYINTAQNIELKNGSTPTAYICLSTPEDSCEDITTSLNTLSDKVNISSNCYVDIYGGCDTDGFARLYTNTVFGGLGSYVCSYNECIEGVGCMNNLSVCGKCITNINSGNAYCNIAPNIILKDNDSSLTSCIYLTCCTACLFGKTCVNINSCSGVNINTYSSSNSITPYIQLIAESCSNGTRCVSLICLDTVSGAGRITTCGTINGCITNVYGGKAGSLLYQSAASCTTSLDIGSSGQVLVSNGSKPIWCTYNSFSASAASSTIYFMGSTSNSGTVTSAYYNACSCVDTSGNMYAVSYTATSARSKKKDIVPTTHEAIKEINNIEIVDFKFKDDETETPRIGFIADDTDEIFSVDKQHFDINNTVGMLLKAVQELSKKNEELEERLKQLES